MRKILDEKKNVETKGTRDFDGHRWIVFEKILFTGDANLALDSFTLIILYFDDTKIVSCIEDLRWKRRFAKERRTIEESRPDSAVCGKATDRTVQEHRTIAVGDDATRWNSPANFDLRGHRHVGRDSLPFRIWKANCTHERVGDEEFSWSIILFEIKLSFGTLEFSHSYGLHNDSETFRHEKHADQKWNGETHSEIDVLVDMSTKIGP